MTLQLRSHLTTVNVTSNKCQVTLEVGFHIASPCNYDGHDSRQRYTWWLTWQQMEAHSSQLLNCCIKAGVRDVWMVNSVMTPVKGVAGVGVVWGLTTHWAASRVGLPPSPKLLSLLPYMAMARQWEKPPLFLSSGIGLGPAPLRHPASSRQNDKALTLLMFARCNAQLSQSISFKQFSPFCIPPLLCPENGWRNRRPRCWQRIRYVQSWLCRRWCSTCCVPLHCWTSQTSGTVSS